jgi:hypothetical protein
MFSAHSVVMCSAEPDPLGGSEVSLPRKSTEMFDEAARPLSAYQVGTFPSVIEDTQQTHEETV